MSCDFDNCLLADVADLIRGVSYKPQDLIAVSGDQATALLRATNIGINELELTDVLYVPSKLVKNPQQLIKFDVVIAMSSGSRKAVGRLAQLRQNWNGTFGAFCGVIRPKVEKIDPAYLGYVLHSPEFRARIDTFAAGTAIMNLTKDSLLNFPIKLPPKQVQVQVAQILGSLDDRIKLLRETNLTLGAIAQSLFKSWFVDFNPVRAKQEGTQPEGMDEATAALFPDSFEQSNLGEIPNGWEVKQIGDVVETLGGGTPDTKVKEYWEPQQHFWTTPKDLSGINSPVLIRTERKLSDQGIRKISSGLLPKGTLLMSSRAPIGYLAITQSPMAINQGYIAIPPNGNLSPLFMLFWCKTNMEAIKSRANGSTFLEISKKVFRPMLVAIPNKKILDIFEIYSASLFSKVVENEKQIQTLTTIRDTLLPRLISGQIKLPDATEQIDAETV